MTYLITGGAGFIGSHVAQLLLQRGDSVVLLDNFNGYYDVSIKREKAATLGADPACTVVEGDIRDVNLVREIFQTHEITHVAHLAAMAGVRASIHQTPLYMDVNVTGSMNIFEAARDHDVQQMVLASTSSVYGKTQKLPFVETDTADRPLASYPASKRAAEVLAHTYHNLNGMNVNILRFFNVYGPAGRPDMMPLRLMQAAISGEEIPIYNEGQISRDWTYVADTSAGVIKALDTPLGYEIMNIGVGSPILLTDFVEIVEELSGREINKHYVDAPLSEPPITYCNNQKARDLIGFDPQISVQEGLRRTWEWFREHQATR